jgi:hypothetical protein
VRRRVPLRPGPAISRGTIRYLKWVDHRVDAVPVLIARRIPFVTFRLLSPCGFIIHQTYNQLLPQSESALAAQLREKTLLGYHDIRVGNDPDTRGSMPYEEFAARVRRRQQGVEEGHDPEEEFDFDYD